MTEGQVPVSQADRAWLDEDTWASIPAYMHKHIMARAALHRLAETERAAKVCDDLAATAATVQAAMELHGHEAPLANARRETAETLATAIRSQAHD